MDICIADDDYDDKGVNYETVSRLFLAAQNKSTLKKWQAQKKRKLHYGKNLFMSLVRHKNMYKAIIK